MKPLTFISRSTMLLTTLFLISEVMVCNLVYAGESGGVATVIKIIDGDSIRVIYRSESIDVRLWGIDTPEYKQPFSKKAANFTRKMVAGKSVSLEVKDWDDYGRMVAIVKTGRGGSLNEALIKAGLAWVHIYYCKEAICDSWYGYEKEVRLKNIGLWSEKNPVAPWVWKRRKKVSATLSTLHHCR